MQALQDESDTTVPRLWQLATGLGAGMGRAGLVCGALTGGILALGVASAASGNVSDLTALKEGAYAQTQDLVRRFKAELGATDCAQLTGCDLQTGEGRALFQRNKTLDRVCRPAVRLAVQTVTELRGNRT